MNDEEQHDATRKYSPCKLKALFEDVENQDTLRQSVFRLASYSRNTRNPSFYVDRAVDDSDLALPSK